MQGGSSLISATSLPRWSRTTPSTGCRTWLRTWRLKVAAQWTMNLCTAFSVAKSNQLASGRIRTPSSVHAP